MKYAGIIFCSLMLFGCAVPKSKPAEPMVPRAVFEKFRKEQNELDALHIKNTVVSGQLISELIKWQGKLSKKLDDEILNVAIQRIQLKADFRLFLRAMKRRGIKIDLGKERELLVEEELKKTAKPPALKPVSKRK